VLLFLQRLLHLPNKSDRASPATCSTHWINLSQRGNWLVIDHPTLSNHPNQYKPRPRWKNIK